MAGCLAGGTLWAAGMAQAGEDVVMRPYETHTSTNGWEYSWTPYGWLTGLFGNATIKGRTIQIDASFIDIVENSNSLIALMGYGEARKGPVTFYLDTVYADLTGSAEDVDFFSGPFGDLDIAIEGAAEATYKYAVVEAGVAYEVARTPSSLGNHGAYTAFDILAGARYWYQETDVKLNVDVNVDLPDGFSYDGRFAVASSGDMQWVDPVAGIRLRHSFGGGHGIFLKGDVAGLSVGSDFSWQLVGAYSWEFATRDNVTYAGVIGYRALSVDYEQGSGKNKRGIDGTYRGPIIGMTVGF